MERCARENSATTHSNRAVRHSSTPARELARRAIWLAAIYCTAHLLGLRGYVSALLEGSKSSLIERIDCVTYLFLYGSFVMLVPTLLIAALMLVAWNRLRRSAVDGLSEPRPASETPTTTGDYPCSRAL